MNKYVDFKAFRKDTEAALGEVAKKYGINIHAGNISYDDNTFTMQLKAERADVDVAKAKFESDLMFMKHYGFTADDYRREVILDGKQYVITGFKPGNKYDVCTERFDGKHYVHVHSAVIAALGRTA